MSSTIWVGTGPDLQAQTLAVGTLDAQYEYQRWQLATHMHGQPTAGPPMPDFVFTVFGPCEIEMRAVYYYSIVAEAFEPVFGSVWGRCELLAEGSCGPPSH